MSVKLVNTRNDQWSFRFLTKPGKGGEIKTVTIGAAEDNGIVGKVSPTVVITDEVFEKIRPQLANLIAHDEFSSPHIRVIKA